MAAAMMATDNASIRPPTQQPQPARITGEDSDFQRLHTATVRRLDRAVRRMLRNLRIMPGQNALIASVFIDTCTDILRAAYEDAHREGQRDYWQSVSRKTRGLPFVEPDDGLTAKRLAWYAAPSLTKMAREAQMAAAAAKHNAGVFAEMGLALTFATDDGGDGGDELDQWYAALGPRIEMQANISWAGMQDGYGNAGSSDVANPYALVYWLLDPFVRVHCNDCIGMAQGSPYSAPGTPGGLPQVPGDGETECGAGCKCSLSYEPGPAGIPFLVDPNVWRGFLPSDLPLPNMSFPGTLEDWQARYDDARAANEALRAQMERAYQTGAARDAVLARNYFQAGVDMVTAQQALDTLREVAAQEAAVREGLTDAQKGALDTFRAGWNAWEAARGELPPAPQLFTPEAMAGGDLNYNLQYGLRGLPPFEELTAEQQAALIDMVQGIVAWEVATGAVEGVTSDENTAESGEFTTDTGESQEFTESQDDAADDEVQHTGVMVAFMLKPNAARRLALPDGEPASELHITLTFHGDASDLPLGSVDRLKRTVAAFAAAMSPLSGKVSGIGRFNPSPSSDGMVPVFASVNVPGLHRWRHELAQQLEAAGVPADATFAYTPHITLAYIAEGAEMPVRSVPPVRLTLDAVTVAIGDERTTYRLGGVPALKH